MRGEADAARNRIYADAFGRDPEFFSFSRSLTSYERALTGDNSSMVLSPDSDFFRFLRQIDPTGTGAQITADNAEDAAAAEQAAPAPAAEAAPAPAADAAPAAPAPAANARRGTRSRSGKLTFLRPRFGGAASLDPRMTPADIDHPLLEPDERLLVTFAPDRNRYWRDHGIMAVGLMALAGGVLWLIGSPYPAIGSGAVLAVVACAGCIWRARPSRCAGC
ncbi:hypothetical protein OKA06_18785 [Novosphingobium sp. MW5]|nr:hypothetical protein [Novosphingobium sp. MW5]